MTDETAAADATAAGEAVDRPATLDEAIGTPGSLIGEIADELGAKASPDAPGTGGAGPGGADEPITPVVLDELVDHAEAAVSMRDMRMLADIDVEVTVEFGRARLELRDLLSLRRGSLVELSRGLDQPVGILANNTLVAYGEVVMVGDRFGVHVLEIVDPSERAKPQRLDRTTPGVAVEHQWADEPASATAASTDVEGPDVTPDDPSVSESPSEPAGD